MPKARIWEAGAVDGQITDQNRWIEIGWTKGYSLIQVGVGCDVESPNAQWMSLDDRSAVNRMIRELRNARDAAFGKDA